MNDFIIWLLFIFVFIIIIGLYISEFTPLNLDEKEKILKLNYVAEHFTPSVSSTDDQLEGASELYNWGLPDDTPPPIVNKKTDCDHTCKPTCPEVCPYKCPEPRPLPSPPSPPPPVQTCTPQQSNNNSEMCRKCDITQNKDIDKYVLKSSVTPCPDMSEFITKNMMNANPDLSDYILKSEIKPCEKVDINNYILKSQIPACPTCPICPECPICPICPDIPPEKKCKEIHEYNITEHPDITKFIRLDDLKKNYIRKDQILNNDIVKNYINKNCQSNNNNSSNNVILPNIYEETKHISKPNNIFEETMLTPNNIIYEESKSELLGNNILGYYAGDSLFAGV
jgi:hypothetical protein